MSTRGNIAIKLSVSDREGTLKYNPQFTPMSPIMMLERVGTIEPLGKPYLQIYNHHDSYPSHLGRILLNHYNDYEKALNLVLAGDTSGVDENSTDAYVKYDSWGDVKPEIIDEPYQDEQYLYVYEDGQWFIQGKEYPVLTPLTQEIIDND